MNQEAEANKPNSRPSRLIVLLLVAATVIGGAVFWEQYLEDRIIPKRWGVVEDGLIYRSGQLHAALVKETLEKNGIEVVIDLTKGEAKSENRLAEKAAIEELSIESHQYELEGNGTGDLGEYTQAVAALYHAAESKKKVLVHCAAGSQRTGGTVALYRLLVQGKGVNEIIDEMEDYDWDREDDVVMLNFLNEHMAEICDRLVRLAVLDKAPDPLPILRP